MSNPDWVNKIPVDMTTEELVEARDWFRRMASELISKAQRLQEGEIYLNHQLVVKLGLPYDSAQAPNVQYPSDLFVVDSDT